MSVIKIENLVRDYGDGKGIYDISFHVDQGGSLWLFRSQRCRKNNNHTPFDGIFKAPVREMYH